MQNPLPNFTTELSGEFLSQLGTGRLPTPEREEGSWDPLCNSAAAAAKSLQLCPTLCDPVDDSPPGSPIPGIPQARTLEWVAISLSSAWKWKVKVRSLSHVQLPATPWTAAHQAPLSIGFSRQEYWSGVPLASPYVTLANQNGLFFKYPSYHNLPLNTYKITQLEKWPKHYCSLANTEIKPGEERPRGQCFIRQYGSSKGDLRVSEDTDSIWVSTLSYWDGKRWLVWKMVSSHSGFQPFPQAPWQVMVTEHKAWIMSNYLT